MRLRSDYKLGRVPTFLVCPIPYSRMSHQSRPRSTSCSSTASQSSMASIYARIHQSAHLAEPQEGLTNVYGSFTTTIPAALWLRDHIAFPRKRPDCGYDTPPDSPLSFFQSFPGSRRSPYISRTLLTDPDYPAPSVHSHISFPPSLATVCDDHADTLPPVLKAIERSSRLSCRSICSACMKQGTNFPRCPRCDEMWCSRACRLQGGKKHVCAIRNL